MTREHAAVLKPGDTVYVAPFQLVNGVVRKYPSIVGENAWIDSGYAGRIHLLGWPAAHRADGVFLTYDEALAELLRYYTARYDQAVVDVSTMLIPYTAVTIAVAFRNKLKGKS